MILADILEPLPPLGLFDSVGLSYLLYCIPGSVSVKAVVFDHIRSALTPGGRIFGATILQGDVVRSWPAQALMNLYNRKGIFSNAGDTLKDFGLSPQNWTVFGEARVIDKLGSLEELRDTIHRPAGGPRLFVVKVKAENLPRSLPPRDAVHVKNRFRANLGFSSI